MPRVVGCHGHGPKVKYAEGHNGENYFSVLTKIHNALGLGVQFGSASVLAYLVSVVIFIVGCETYCALTTSFRKPD
ncbi:hypothetical protein P5673_022663 [Acropora cervicornis]|uniref:Uncharacterized protein n=1 Tax=Acropora cervicornis TaxID=6130 RepID=A0AAD9Q798_ACRCE|nr:hypothetical protein P5673_022663 [Acropora cervicornis]